MRSRGPTVRLDQVSAGAAGMYDAPPSVRRPKTSGRLRLVVLAAIATTILAILVLGGRFIACGCAEPPPHPPVVCGCLPPQFTQDSVG
jgi:hypothetical protein